MDSDQHDGIDWRDGTVPVSRRFDDPYYSLAGGLDETRHVFLTGNALPARFRDGFHIAELGFGTGLNLLATVAAWRDTRQPGTLQFTSFEAYPLTAAQMQRAQAGFPALADLSRDLAAIWSAGPGVTMIDGLRFRLIAGDARATLPAWGDLADAWYLDGFSPARNPELWAPDLLAEVARHTAPQGTAASYTAAGHVRRALEAAGFEVTRDPGFGRKRHMTRAILSSAP